MAEKTGIKAVIATLPLDALGMAPQRSMFDAGTLPAPPPAARRGKGRPPGSLNKRTLLARGALTRRQGDALAELQAIAFADPGEISRSWMITREQAAALKVACLKELAEYQHIKRRHLKIEGEGGFFGLAIFNGGRPAAEPGPGAAPLGPISALFPQGEGNQEVVEGTPLPTDTAPTDTAEKTEGEQ